MILRQQHAMQNSLSKKNDCPCKALRSTNWISSSEFIRRCCVCVATCVALLGRFWWPRDEGRADGTSSDRPIGQMIQRGLVSFPKKDKSYVERTRNSPSGLLFIRNFLIRLDFLIGTLIYVSDSMTQRQTLNTKCLQFFFNQSIIRASFHNLKMMNRKNRERPSWDSQSC